MTLRLRSPNSTSRFISEIDIRGGVAVQSELNGELLQKAYSCADENMFSSSVHMDGSD